MRPDYTLHKNTNTLHFLAFSYGVLLYLQCFYATRVSIFNKMCSHYYQRINICNLSLVLFRNNTIGCCTLFAVSFGRHLNAPMLHRLVRTYKNSIRYHCSATKADRHCTGMTIQSINKLDAV